MPTSNEQRVEQIHAYLDGEMSEEEQHHFECKLQTDAELAEDVQLLEIEQYLTHQLSDSRKAAFEKRLKEEECLAHEVAFHCKTIKVLQDIAHREIKKECKHKQRLLNFIGQTNTSDNTTNQAANPVAKSEMFSFPLSTKINNSAPPQTTEKVNGFLPKKIMKQIGILIIFLLPFSYLYFLTNTIEANPFVRFFQPYAMEVLVQNIADAVDEEQEAEIIEACKLYKQKKYQAALPLFKKLITQDKKESVYYLYAANCELIIGAEAEAIKHLENVLQIDREYQQEAQWYLSLAYMQAKEEAKAMKLLKKMNANETHPYKDRAGELLAFFKK